MSALPLPSTTTEWVSRRSYMLFLRNSGMGFFDRWSANPDGSYTDTRNDSSGSTDNTDSGGSDTDESDSDNNEPTDQSNPGVGLGGGGGVSDTTGGSSGSGGSDNPFGGDGGVSTPDIMPDNDNPFEDIDGGSGGSTSGSSSGGGGSDSDDGGSDPNRQSGSGIGPGGVSGSEAATPDSETDAPQNDSTESIDATRTGQLEDTATDPQVRQQAEALEDRVAGQKVTDVVSGLTTTGAELREEDIEVTRDGDTLEAQLSPVGRERVGNIADRQADEQAERAVEEQLNTAFDNQDVSVDNSGNVGVSEDVQQEATEQDIAEENPGVREDDVVFQNGEPQVQQPEPTDPAEQVEDRTGLKQGRDFTVDEDGTVNVTERGARELRALREQEQGDALTDGVAGFEGITGIDLPGNRSVAGEARQRAANDPSGELFGGRGGVEQWLRGKSESISSTATDAADSFGNVAAANPLVDMLDPAPDGVEVGGINETTTPDTQEERNRAELFGGVVEGPAQVLNPAQLGVTAIELGEAGRAGVNATTVAGGSQEDFEEFESQAAGGAAVRATDTTRAAQQQPFRTGGQVLGGAVASSGLLAAGRRIGGSTGARTAGAVVQPGEELLKTLRRTDSSTGSTTAAGATSGTKLGSGGTGTLFDADALDAGRGPSTGSRVRGRIDRADTPDLPDSLKRFIDDTRGQQQIGRPRGDSDTGSTPDAPSDFEPSRSEVLEGSPRDRLSDDVADRTQTQRRQNSGAFDGRQDTDPGRTRAETENARRRQQQAQQQEVTQPARTPDGSTSPAADVGVGVGAGVGSVVGQAEQSAVDDVFSNDDGFGSATDTELDLGGDVGFDLGAEIGSGTRTELGQEFRSELGTETRVDVGSETGQVFGTEPATEIDTELGTETRQEPRTELGTELGFEGSTRRETSVDLDSVLDDDEPAGLDFSASDEVFDTGVAQSLDDLDSGGSGDPLDGFDRLL